MTVPGPISQPLEIESFRKWQHSLNTDAKAGTASGKDGRFEPTMTAISWGEDPCHIFCFGEL